MVRETYADADVAAFLSAEVLPMHVNSEVGEGKELAERYGIEALPTLLIVDARGEEIARFGGYSPPKQFIASMRALLDGESFSDLKQKVAEDPTDLSTTYRLAMRYVYRGAIEEARPLLVRVAATENPSKELRLAGEVNLAVLESTVTGNTAPLERFFRSNPDSPFAGELADHLFQDYAQQDDIEKAIEVAELAIAKTEWREDPVLIQRYALFLAEHDTRPARAQELVVMAVKLAPDDPAVHDRAGNVYERCGERALALAARRRAVELAGETERAKYEQRLRKLAEAPG